MVIFRHFITVFYCYPMVNIEKALENHHFQWENPLFLWSCSIAMLVYQRVHVWSRSIIDISCSIMTYPVQLLEDSDRPLGNIMRLPIACVGCSTNELDIAQPTDSLVSDLRAHESADKNALNDDKSLENHETWPLKMNIDSSRYVLTSTSYFV